MSRAIFRTVTIVPNSKRMMVVDTHDLLAGSEVHLREDRDRQLHAQQHLRQDQSLERIADQEYDGQGGDER